VLKFFRLLFKNPWLRKRYYYFYIYLFKPLNLFRNKTTIATYDSGLKIKLELDEWIQQQIYLFGHFDEKGINFMKKNLKQGDVFFDIGANIGCYTLIASKITGTSGQVFAFEAIREVYEKLMFNIRLNQMTEIKAENVAIFEKEELLNFYVSSRENIGMSSIFHHDTERGDTVQVQAISVDEYVKQNHINRIDFIKLDIEGAELHALNGMRETLKRFRPILLMELSTEVLPNTPLTPDEITQLLRELNYRQMAITQSGDPVPMDQNPDAFYHNYAFVP
jgi:FkbM family methyltransferase